MRLLMFAGAGTSVELGVPAMEGLAREFLLHASQWDVEPELLTKMMGETLDVEHLIESLDRICDAQEPLRDLVDTIPLGRIDKIRSEIEWFVQHAAERIAARDAHLLWGPLLRLKAHDLTFITTNYDRAIELAANAETVRLYDGFDEFAEKEVASWIGFDPNDTNPKLVKLHGSTDWYSERTSGSPLKLRHPMPLFGRAMLELANGERLGSALVLPSREKILNKKPYPRLSQAFLNAADTCDAAIFVGSSMRDQHVRGAASEIASERPVFVVNRGGNTFDVPRAIGIAQSASQFLISTLPAALSAVDSIRGLEEASVLTAASKGSVLALLRLATDPQEPTDRRCDAIERLDQQGVTLDQRLVKDLLLDKNPTVARYALGLLPISPDRTELLSAARLSPHRSDPSFAEEVALLEKMTAEGKWQAGPDELAPL